MKQIVIGSRGSDLAMWQARYIQMELRRVDVEATIEVISTKGDEIQNIGFDKMEGKGFFTKEIEEALLSHKIDLAVHSHKDLETTSPPGLRIAAVSYREDPVDLLLIRKEKYDATQLLNLAPNSCVGTSSARRKSQMHAFRPDVTLKDLRGNVPTRVNKLRNGDYDAILVAKAGISRLEIDLEDFHVEELDPRQFIPAPAQGVLALQIRTIDEELFELVKKLNNPDVECCIEQERKLLQDLHGGCQLPMGAYCIQEDEVYHFWASMSANWKEIPMRYYESNKRPDNFAKNALKALTTKSNAKVFISRKLKADDYLFRALHQNGYQVEGHSLTKYEKVDFTKVPECDWLFFSSKNCVKFFYEQKPQIEKKVKVGSIGGATALALKQLGIKSDYIGDSNDTVSIGKEFARVASGAKIVFPQSTASYRTVQKQFNDQKSLIDLVVYDTIPNEKVNVPTCDILVFTSPTNALLYLRKYSIAEHQQVIAIGKSTAEVLKDAKVNPIHLPWATSELALADAVMSLC